MSDSSASSDTPRPTRQNNSAGIILCRFGKDDADIEILLVHPGGPFWAKKDTHGWSIPKGEYDPDDEDAEAAAVREFREETGHPVPDGPRIALPAFKAGRKNIRAWLVGGNLDPDDVMSNSFEMEWPPKSGQLQSFPEVDRAGWFSITESRTKLHKGQLPVCDLIERSLDELRGTNSSN